MSAVVMSQGCASLAVDAMIFWFSFVCYNDLGMTTLFWLPDLVQRVHLKGGFKVTQAAWATMKQQGYGRYSIECVGVSLQGSHGARKS